LFRAVCKIGPRDKPHAPLLLLAAEELDMPYQNLINLYLRDCVAEKRRPRMTSPGLSPRRSPQVRCKIVPLMPPGFTSHVSGDHRTSLSFASSSHACGLTASSCSYGQGFATRFFPPSPRGWALRFATVVVTSSGWHFSANSILPMLGTQTPGFRLVVGRQQRSARVAPKRLRSARAAVPGFW
jgi:hypothetical protein